MMIETLFSLFTVTNKKFIAQNDVWQALAVTRLLFFTRSVSSRRRRRSKPIEKSIKPNYRERKIVIGLEQWLAENWSHCAIRTNNRDRRRIRENQRDDIKHAIFFSRLVNTCLYLALDKRAKLAGKKESIYHLPILSPSSSLSFFKKGIFTIDRSRIDPILSRERKKLSPNNLRNRTKKTSNTLSSSPFCIIGYFLIIITSCLPPESIEKKETIESPSANR